jgi:hypothetical protein
MKTLAGISLLLALVTVMSLSAPAARGQQGSAGLIEKLNGTVFLRHDGNAKETRLDPKSDVARRLYPGEQVRCEPGGFVRLRVGGRLKEIYGPSAWFTIPRKTGTQTNPLQKALDEYGRRGGRDRGDLAPTVALFSPSDRSVVTPELFSIRWLPLKTRCTASFIVRDANGEQVWRQDGVRGRAGMLNSVAARRALRRYRNKAGAGPLELTLTSSCGEETQSQFSLLGVADEQKTKRELAAWAKEPGNLTRHIGRAEVFHRYGLFPQAAAEYEAALSKAPRSRELLTRTIVAQRRIGNSAREQELSKRLPAGSELP